CTFNAEPLARNLDLMVLGDGEAALPEVLEAWSRGRESGMGRAELLASMRSISGVYVPSLFTADDEGGVRPVLSDYTVVRRAVVPDLDSVTMPSRPVVPFSRPVHDRLTLEVARGCTRGCRFCQAGMIYRPVRERRPETLGLRMSRGLAATGFEEVSFLSLSTGDFSALDRLFDVSLDLCSANQVSIALPSLRAGTVSEEMFAAMASLKRTGLTIAPEAGTQRLRDVINKGVTESDILDHAARAFGLGWQAVKLYFMIGLPTETREDLDGILDLCLKVLAQAGPKARRVQITASISPFVPKPHTPFQWESQMTLSRLEETLEYVKALFRPHRRIQVKWHHSHMSYLEGIFSRGGRELGPVLEDAYLSGQVFTSWTDHLDIHPWLEILRRRGLDPDRYLRARPLDSPLPWDHLHCGVSRRFLDIERQRALQGAT
ncbi:MAG: TIGR03960 family B12-binding radical SAM protein, partial [Deltaproteobacteria bacterium]|nr:TIGR03960 family B12-binding radical SAM protein [Deltaproteobacteria bacterium]